jgi:chaperone BCS1
MKIINLSLCSYKHDITYINKFLETKEQEYLNFINKDTNKLKIFTTSSYYDHDIGNQALKFNKYYLSSNKSFQTLFFEGKDQIINRLERYNKNITEYKRLGIPHTLGFLFHGVPGSGKTSTIKAIANYTNRSIISVNMNHIGTIEDMIKLFNNELVSFSKIPLNKRMYVFEEIDCYDYFLSREFVKEEPKEENKIEDMLTEIVNKKKHNKKKKDDSKLTIGQILEVLDGIIECEDRIIIFTTNHVEKIDKALMRPGRIDMVIEFKKLRKQDIQD